ncbi:TIGR04066 family peptide maturation system protein [Clostridium butyricum]|uniref:TIGR04066 family peptide maturation system protein n=1 Tax=Clostridium butyricum TaxID=1492 RepID=A0A0A6SJ26_CLOBU|nr:TIGR04066 family peptide maturation system protein [Clostridium butyricum]KHD13715.1 hypothetical protein OA81_19260 [Clostridium butyricum]KHD15701.1 hypothetical protein OA81_07645 [Clostridium butyricum]PPV12131.1 hypothetical protein AWN73_19845 [Clostridium butyricum]
MSIKEKVLIYPFDREFMPMLRSSSFNDKYEVIGLVSPNGWGVNGKNAGYLDLGEDLCIKISKDFFSLIDECDTVIFNKSNISLDFDKFIKPKLNSCIEKNKNIICTIFLEKEVCDYISEKCISSNKYFKYYDIESMIGNYECDVEYIHKFNTPVIFVLGMSECTNKFYIQLQLRDIYKKTGYKIAQIGSKHYCEMLDFHSMPVFMYSSNIADYKKIVMFNHYLKNIEVTENPDLIIIGVPGGLFPINDQFTNKFGIMAYEIARAVTPDAVVLSTLYEKYNSKFFNEVCTVVRYRFGADVDCCNISNMKFDWSTSSQNNLLSYTMIDSKVIDNMKDTLTSASVPIYNCLNNKDIKTMADYIIEKLSSYSDIETV